MRTSRTARWAAIPAVAALALTACSFDSGGETSTGGESSSGDSGSTGEPAADGHITIALQFTPSAGFALETDDAFVLTQVGCMETLLTYNYDSGELEPLLATDWTQTEPTVWDFTLREGVMFNNGAELTTQIVADSLNAALEVEAPARAWRPNNVESIEALDDTTVRITTPEPSALLPYRVASVNTGILAPEAFSGTGVDPIGNCTGPFEVTDYTPQQNMNLVRNDNWWGGDVALASVEARFIPEGATRATQVQTGESDIALGIASTSVPELEGNADVVVSRQFQPRTVSLYLNNSQAPFDDVNVRRAVQLALNLEEIVIGVYDSNAEPAFGPFAASEPWAPSDLTPVQQNIEEAQQLLADAGYEPGELEVEILAYTERTEFADLAAVIQAQLGEIGITVTPSLSDYAAIEPSLLEGTFDMSLLSRNHLTDIADPAGFFGADYTCEGGYNISHFCDPAIDEMIATASGSDDPDERYSIYAEVASFIQEEAITIALVTEQAVAASRTTVTGFADDPLNRYAITAETNVTE